MDISAVKELTALQAQWNTAFVVVAVFLVIALGMFAYNMSEQKKDREEARKITQIRMNREDVDKKTIIKLSEDVTSALTNSNAVTQTIIDMLADTRDMHLIMDSDIKEVKGDIERVKNDIETVKQQIKVNGITDEKIIKALDDIKKTVETLGK